MSGIEPIAITHVVENLNRGGLERVVIDLVRTQKAMGHRCQVVCVFEPGTLADELGETGIPVLACRKDRLNAFGVLWRLRRAIRRFGAGVVHTHNAVAHYYAVLASAGWPLAAVVSTRHGLGDLDPTARRERYYRYAMRGTDAVVAVSAALRERFARGLPLPDDRVLAIPNGIDVKRFEPAATAHRCALRTQLGFGAGTRIIGTVGRLNWAKDQATLIRAFAQLRRQGVDIGLALVGGGELKGDLENLAATEGVADSVRFLGDRGDIPELLRGFDLFALSSVREGYSIALLEACAAGLPIAATAVGGNAEIVRDGINGRVVPASDAPAFATAMAEILADPPRTEAMGDAGRTWALKHGSLESMARRYQGVYEQARAIRSTR